MFTDGRIVPGIKPFRKQGRRTDYLLRYTRNSAIAVVEAKAIGANPYEGFQQSKDYAAILGLHFAYATNGQLIIEFDALTGLETERDSFPTPAELWTRRRNGLGLAPDTAERILRKPPSTVPRRQS